MTKLLYGIGILALSAGLAVAQSSPTDQSQAGQSSTPNQTTTAPDNSATAPSAQSSGQSGATTPSGQATPDNSTASPSSSQTGTSGAAQSAPSTTTTQQSTTTTTTQSPSGVQGSATSGQTTSVTGCLQGSSGSYNLTDNNGKSYPMTQIATEGGLLSRPVPRPNGVLLSMAERIEVVIDFSQFPAGTTALYLENRLNQTSGRGPGGDFNNPDLLSSGTRILKFNLQPGTVSDSSQVPQALRPFAPISASEISKAVVRNFQFDRSDGGWVINGQFVDLTRPLASPSKTGVGEIWRLKNGGGGWWHPIHIHLEFGRVLKRNGSTPFGGGAGDHGQSLEQDGVAKKDTYLLGPGDQVDVFLRFRDFVGPYVFHCHNIEHEDMAMMARFDVAP